MVLPAVRPRKRPMHGVALVEAGAEHDQHVRRIGEDRRGRVAGPGIAEHAEGERVVLGKYALGAQRRRDRDRPSLRARFEERRRVVVLDAGAGEEHDLRPAAQDVDGGNRGRCAQRGDRLEIRGNRRVIRGGRPGQRVVGERQVHRTLGLSPHHGERATERVIEGSRGRDRFRQARDWLHHGGVVERRLARVLEFAEALHVDRNLARQHQDRRAIGLGGGDRGRHVGETGAADAQNRAEAAAGAGIAIGHVGGATLMGGNDGTQPWHACERRQEGIDETARHHEEVGQSLLHEGVEDEVATHGHRRTLASSE